METVRPEEVGLSGPRLARIDDHLRRHYLKPGKIAGALTLVWRRGALAWCSPLGLRDRERERPMTEDTIFRIYSMTKPLTAVALMALHEEGRFRLDDPVHRWIPAWRGLRVYAGGTWPQFETRPCERPVTVRDLLSHQAGLTYGFQQRTPVDAAYRQLGIGSFGRTFDGDLGALVAALAELPLEFSPGTAWNYSVASDVCGYLVEALSGEPFDAFLRRRILEPLGMEDTGFHVPDDRLERFAACYTRGPRKELRRMDDPEKSRYREPPALVGGGGGLVSTARDYLRFCRMLLGGGVLEGTRILSRKTLELMAANHLAGGRDLREAAVGMFSETDMAGTGYGLGFAVTLDPARAGVAGSPGELAWGGAASTFFWVDPAEELIVLYLTQLFPSRTFDFRGQIKAIVYGAIDDGAAPAAVAGPAPGPAGPGA